MAPHWEGYQRGGCAHGSQTFLRRRRLFLPPGDQWLLLCSPLGHQGGLGEVQALGAGKVLQEAELVQRRRLETEGSQCGV